MYRNQDLDEALRKARPQMARETALRPDFDAQVMQELRRVKRQRMGRPHGVQELRIAGVSLVLAGIMLFFLNATPLGQDLSVLAASVKSTTVKVEKYHFTLPDWGDFWFPKKLEKRDSR